MIRSHEQLLSTLDRFPCARPFGYVVQLLGMLVEIAGLEGQLSVGDRCLLGEGSLAEIVGFRQRRALALAYDSLEGIALHSRAYPAKGSSVVRPSPEWLGRCVDAYGHPADGRGPLKEGSRDFSLRQSPPPAHARQRLGPRIDLGVRAMNLFTTCCRGQRLGLFAASGIGKSVLMAMMARNSASDVNVIGLIGERGREVQEFLQDELGPEGLAKSVTVIATSDESALARRQAALLTMALAEYFRDEGRDVLLMMDSVTRYAMAMREIGLAVGEPPTAKGYTPSVFAELPKLLERAGPSKGRGSITGIFTVLVEGDDHDEPIADAVRGILDGHVVLERQIAERGRYPAINVLRSLSRSMPGCNTNEENTLVSTARRYLAAYANMEELIRLGAYKKGSDALTDKAIDLYPALDGLLAQNRTEAADLQQSYACLRKILEEVLE
ncbi:MAG TPA: flagellar protein export ATPase FliI [Dongiaceae bacterium]|jgi:flagellum-specific ATP synthase|nr:flagellar protein export ATPase FliI [Dongiaceae bacterium]